MFGSIGTPELVVIFFIVLLVFGKDKIPELARALGKASRQFRKAMDDVKDEINFDDIKRDFRG
ncbi:twin-arginine translocase TatA/TatE family subunit [candidate division KSB1 bacterium]|nr:twin-arginine translocase TatA/TatE family subunit [candidate division KSB1 bacterium]